jgi:hypothetical protein
LMIKSISRCEKEASFFWSCQGFMGLTPKGSKSIAKMGFYKSGEV